MLRSRNRRSSKTLVEIAEEQRIEAFSKGVTFAHQIASKEELKRFMTRYQKPSSIHSHLKSNRKDSDVARDLAIVIMPSGSNRYHSSSDVFWGFAYGDIPENDDCVRAFAEGILSTADARSVKK